MTIRCLVAGLAWFLFLPYAAGAQPADVNLQFAIWSDNPVHLELLSAIGRAYQVDHPNVRVEFVPIQPYSAFSKNMTIRLTSSKPPDLGWMLERFAPQFISSSSLVDLRKAAEKYDYEDFSSSALSLWVRDGLVYGLPFSTSPFFILYNKDLFARAELQTPNEMLERNAWTWENLRNAAMTIKNRTGHYAYSFWMDDDPVVALIPIVRAYGGDAWGKNGKCGLNSPNALKAVKLFHQMLAVDKSIPPFRQNLTEEKNFFSGEVAMTIAQLSMVEKLKNVNFSWDMVPLPAGPVGKIGLFGQAAVVVYAAGKHQDIAADFAAYLTNKKNVLKLAKFFPPARVSVVKSRDFLKSNTFVSPEQMKLAVADVLKIAEPLPSNENYGKIELVVRPVFNRLNDKNADVTSIVNDMCLVIDRYLK